MGVAWSVQSLTGIASIAGLSEFSATVCVGPPLLARPALASRGLTLSPLLAEPVLPNPHELSSEML